MQLNFESISEPTKPGKKWKHLFETFWPGYEAWLVTKGVAEKPDLKTAKAMLKKYMPEMVATHQQLCKLAGASPRAAHFLTGWCPPAYVHACSQAVTTKDTIQLVRNYDFHPALFEGTLLLSKWNGKKVISNNDCLIGTVDGINEDGLVISLTFGGRKVVGEGFGIPFILRYVLEFCSNVAEAVSALQRIPTHMAYNVTVIDRSGTYKTVIMAPDREAVVTDAAYTTNHQHIVDWPENAVFNKTVERSEYLKLFLAKKETTAKNLVDAFLRPPLYNSLFKEGFGTLFTSVYQPAEGKVTFRWPDDRMEQSFDSFTEETRRIEFVQAGAPDYKTWIPLHAEVPVFELSSKQSSSLIAQPWQEELADALIESLGKSLPEVQKEQLEKLRKNMIQNGEIYWELMATFWTDKEYTNWEQWVVASEPVR